MFCAAQNLAILFTVCQQDTLHSLGDGTNFLSSADLVSRGRNQSQMGQRIISGEADILNPASPSYVPYNHFY